ncbi:hypothetical protein PspLS_00410 [Pyricularia sp. CBS 133598]|nr:hypothetical protein PspLS_00410 [Pyricularia sp. CBS 133598]
MGSQMGTRAKGASLSLRTGNKLKRQYLNVRNKKDKDARKRAERFKRRKEENADPTLRQERLAKNKPASQDKKRVWDEGDDDSLGAVVDLAALKRRRIEEEENEALEGSAGLEEEKLDEDDDADSMLDSEEEGDDDDDDDESREERLRSQRARRDPSLVPSLAPSLAVSTTSTNLDLTPTSLARKFPTLFTEGPHPTPKILVTTSLRATIHREAQIITSLFPNSQYVPRSSHRYGHKYSLREICKFSTNRDFTAVILIREDQKKPTGMTVVHLPEGPTFHFTINNWIEGSKLPGHGNSQGFYPELLLNRFTTPLGLLTAQLLRRLFPYQPEIAGREVVTIHNQRDYLFVRRHRYVYRERRQTEKTVVDEEGKEIPGFSDIRVGLQEIGPRFTLKLRRVDKGIGRAGSEGDDAVQWEWKAGMEKVRTKFNL